MEYYILRWHDKKWWFVEGPHVDINRAHYICELYLQPNLYYTVIEGTTDIRSVLPPRIIFKIKYNETIH